MNLINVLSILFLNKLILQIILFAISKNDLFCLDHLQLRLFNIYFKIFMILKKRYN